MPLVNPSAMLSNARAGRYAIGAFNVLNSDTLDAVIATAERLQSPVIIAVYRGHIEGDRLEEMATLMRFAAERARIPVALHVDMATGLEEVAQALRYGFTSIWLNPQAMDFDEHVRVAAQVARMCHATGAAVEAELGAVAQEGGQRRPGLQGDPGAMTDPGLAREFVRRTGIDILSIAIGSSHGGEAHLNLERLAEIRAVVDCNLALHGGSGVSPHEIRCAIELGINKVSVFSAMANAAVNGVRACVTAEGGPPNLMKLMAAMRAACGDVVTERVGFFGSGGKAAVSTPPPMDADERDVRMIVERVMRALGDQETVRPR